MTGNPNFAQTATASQVSCQDIGPLGSGEEYTCNISGVQQPTQWLWGNGDVSMVSNGGDQGSPPADANAAASVVQNSGSAGFQPTYVTCAALTHDSIGIAIQNAYNCTLSGDGGQVTVTYRWNNDGTIREEQLAGY